jgi:hypothetical protein
VASSATQSPYLDHKSFGTSRGSEDYGFELQFCCRRGPGIFAWSPNGRPTNDVPTTPESVAPRHETWK